MSNFKCQISNKLGVIAFVIVFIFFSPIICFAKGVEYELPYPGILPGNSFYFLKVVRDRVVEFFVSSPLERAEYDLLQADKRVAAARMLLSKGSEKEDLTGDVLWEGLRYFEDAIVRLQDARKQGMDIDGLVQRMVLANRKHEEVLREMSNVQCPMSNVKCKKLEGEFGKLRERVEGVGIRVKGLRK